MTSPGPTLLDDDAVSIHNVASRDLGTRNTAVLTDDVTPHAVGTGRQGIAEVRPYRYGHSPAWALTLAYETAAKMGGFPENRC